MTSGESDLNSIQGSSDMMYGSVMAPAYNTLVSSNEVFSLAQNSSDWTTFSCVHKRKFSDFPTIKNGDPLNFKTGYRIYPSPTATQPIASDLGDNFTIQLTSALNGIIKQTTPLILIYFF